MSAVQTVVYSSFSPEEEKLLKDFKKEAFYFVGEDIAKYDFWQEFFNLFFIYHFDVGNGESFASKRDLDSASIHLFCPSRFAKMKGSDLISGDKLVFDDDEENSLTWFKERELILSFFTHEDGRIKFVESKTSLVIPMEHASFFKKLVKLNKKDNYLHSPLFIKLLIALLLLKKERYASSKLYNPYVIEEIEKLNLYYDKFTQYLI